MSSPIDTDTMLADGPISVESAPPQQAQQGYPYPVTRAHSEPLVTASSSLQHQRSGPADALVQQAQQQQFEHQLYPEGAGDVGILQPMRASSAAGGPRLAHVPPHLQTTSATGPAGAMHNGASAAVVGAAGFLSPGWGPSRGIGAAAGTSQQPQHLLMPLQQQHPQQLLQFSSRSTTPTASSSRPSSSSRRSSLGGACTTAEELQWRADQEQQQLLQQQQRQQFPAESASASRPHTHKLRGGASTTAGSTPELHPHPLHLHQSPSQQQQNHLQQPHVLAMLLPGPAVGAQGLDESSAATAAVHSASASVAAASSESGIALGPRAVRRLSRDRDGFGTVASTVSAARAEAAAAAAAGGGASMQGLPHAHPSYDQPPPRTPVRHPAIGNSSRPDSAVSAASSIASSRSAAANFAYGHGSDTHSLAGGANVGGGLGGGGIGVYGNIAALHPHSASHQSHHHQQMQYQQQQARGLAHSASAGANAIGGLSALSRPICGTPSPAASSPHLLGLHSSGLHPGALALTPLAGRSGSGSRPSSTGGGGLTSANVSPLLQPLTPGGAGGGGGLSTPRRVSVKRLEPLTPAGVYASTSAGGGSRPFTSPAPAAGPDYSTGGTGIPLARQNSGDSSFGISSSSQMASPLQVPRLQTPSQSSLQHQRQSVRRSSPAEDAVGAADTVAAMVVTAPPPLSSAAASHGAAPSSFPFAGGVALPRQDSFWPADSVAAPPSSSNVAADSSRGFTSVQLSSQTGLPLSSQQSGLGAYAFGLNSEGYGGQMNQHQYQKFSSNAAFGLQGGGGGEQIDHPDRMPSPAQLQQQQQQQTPARTRAGSHGSSAGSSRPSASGRTPVKALPLAGIGHGTPMATGDRDREHGQRYQQHQQQQQQLLHQQPSAVPPTRAAAALAGFGRRPSEARSEATDVTDASDATGVIDEETRPDSYRDGDHHHQDAGTGAGAGVAGRGGARPRRASVDTQGYDFEFDDSAGDSGTEAGDGYDDDGRAIPRRARAGTAATVVDEDAEEAWQWEWERQGKQVQDASGRTARSGAGSASAADRDHDYHHHQGAGPPGSTTPGRGASPGARARDDEDLHTLEAIAAIYASRYRDRNNSNSDSSRDRAGNIQLQQQRRHRPSDAPHSQQQPRQGQQAMLLTQRDVTDRSRSSGSASSHDGTGGNGGRAYADAGVDGHGNGHLLHSLVVSPGQSTVVASSRRGSVHTASGSQASASAISHGQAPVSTPATSSAAVASAALSPAAYPSPLGSPATAVLHIDRGLSPLQSASASASASPYTSPVAGAAGGSGSYDHGDHDGHHDAHSSAAGVRPPSSVTRIPGPRHQPSRVRPRDGTPIASAAPGAASPFYTASSDREGKEDSKEGDINDEVAAEYNNIRRGRFPSDASTASAAAAADRSRSSSRSGGGDGGHGAATPTGAATATHMATVGGTGIMLSPSTFDRVRRAYVDLPTPAGPRSSSSSAGNGRSTTPARASSSSSSRASPAAHVNASAEAAIAGARSMSRPQSRFAANLPLVSPALVVSSSEHQHQNDGGSGRTSTTPSAAVAGHANESVSSIRGYRAAGTSPAAAGNGNARSRTPSRAAADASASAASSSAAVTTTRRSGGVYTRANIEAAKARCRAALGPVLFDRVLVYLREVRGVRDPGAAETAAAAAAAGEGASATASSASQQAPQSRVKQRHVASKLLSLVNGDKSLLPVCAGVEELLYMEAVVAANEAAAAAGRR